MGREITFCESNLGPAKGMKFTPAMYIATSGKMNRHPTKASATAQMTTEHGFERV